MVAASKIDFTTQKATETEIRSHLEACSSNFIPPLGERVNINEYARKIFEKAVTFEAWAGSVLAGMIGVYCNDVTHAAFITTISVMKEFGKLGIGSRLMQTCVDHCRQRNCSEIILEVYKHNHAVIAFHERMGFQQQGSAGDNLVMKISFS